MADTVDLIFEGDAKSQDRGINKLLDDYYRIVSRFASVTKPYPNGTKMAVELEDGKTVYVTQRLLNDIHQAIKGAVRVTIKAVRKSRKRRSTPNQQANKGGISRPRLFTDKSILMLLKEAQAADPKLKEYLNRLYVRSAKGYVLAVPNVTALTFHYARMTQDTKPLKVPATYKKMSYRNADTGEAIEFAPGDDLRAAAMARILFSKDSNEKYRVESVDYEDLTPEQEATMKELRAYIESRK